MAEKPNSLHWYPHDPAKELARTAALSAEAHSAYVKLRDHAWLAFCHGQQPCTLPNDDAELARLAGLNAVSWRRVAPSVRRYFTVVGTVLVDPDLLKLWEVQQAKYDKRANAGGKGGKQKALRKQSGSNATAKSYQLEQELEGTAPKGASTLPPDGAPAPEGARAAAGGDAPSSAEEAQASAEEQLDELRGLVETWRNATPATDTDRLEGDVRRELGIHRGRPFTSRLQEIAFHHRLLARIAKPPPLEAAVDTR